LHCNTTLNGYSLQIKYELCEPARTEFIVIEPFTARTVKQIELPEKLTDLLKKSEQNLRMKDWLKNAKILVDRRMA